ncbi:hypothetical protein Calkro_1953 [Caldicellulosiruptor kronotskyensis 2002]|uniref:Uncharacterized protein n=1 Tax=Caldicellulosiruptor kronotskyensis (strain DSM 18902 / VKM B-2412 / 2002) TaxID=632348 RepID=E4SGC2_CALK2|nr:hypothetical protein Calkro_1953 [Caldicellulosiruptor kronotskyensis 2002]
MKSFKDIKEGTKNISQTVIVSRKDILELTYNDNIFATIVNNIIEIKFSRTITAQHNRTLKKDSTLNLFAKANRAVVITNVIRNDRIYKDIK